MSPTFASVGVCNMTMLTIYIYIYENIYIYIYVHMYIPPVYCQREASVQVSTSAKVRSSRVMGFRCKGLPGVCGKQDGSYVHAM